MNSVTRQSNNFLYYGDCMDYMKAIPEKTIDVTITDPPYGIGKAAWDKEFPTEWYYEAFRVSKMVVIITSSALLNKVIPLVAENFVEVISARNLNGMTYSPIGYGNWIAAVIAGEKPRPGQNFFEFAIRGKMPDHPSPKPLEYMRKLVSRVSDAEDIVFDPFMGSGTTGVACAELGRDFIGCENVPEYFEMAKKRIEIARSQLLLPI